jgi:hypothetical protein
MIFYVIDAIVSLSAGSLVTRVLEVSYRSKFYKEVYSEKFTQSSEDFKSAWRQGCDYALSLDAEARERLHQSNQEGK